MKKWPVLLCALLLVWGLAACGGDAREDTPPSPPAEAGDTPEEIELTLWTFPVGDWGNPTAVSNILMGFHQENPGVHISVEYLDYDSGDEKISQAVQAGNAPDLVLEGPERLVANWGDKGWMADLSDLWQSDAAGTVYENIRLACRNRDGAYFEFPICMSAHCMAINYDLFRDAGALEFIDEENHSWTTEGFIRAVEALNAYGVEKAGIVYCRNQSGDQGTRALVNNLYGGRFTDSAHSVYTVDSDETRRALELLRDLEGIAFEPELTAANAIELFCKKETAMCFCWSASMEVQQTINNPDLDFDVFPMAFPTDQEASRLEGGIWGLGVFDNGDEKKIGAAKSFIRYLTENDAVYTKAVLTSSYWPVRDMENIYENDKLMSEYSVFMQSMGDYYQITPGWAGARAAWWQMLAKVGRGEDIALALKGFPNPD